MESLLPHAPFPIPTLRQRHLWVFLIVRLPPGIDKRGIVPSQIGLVFGIGAVYGVYRVKLLFSQVGDGIRCPGERWVEWRIVIVVRWRYRVLLPKITTIETLGKAAYQGLRIVFGTGRGREEVEEDGAVGIVHWFVGAEGDRPGHDQFGDAVRELSGQDFDEEHEGGLYHDL